AALRKHLDFQVSQFLHMLFFGFWYRTMTDSAAKSASYLERVTKSLELVDFRDGDLTVEPSVIRPLMFNSGVYRLIVAALRARRFDWIETAIMQQSVPQERLYAEMLRDPENREEQDFQS